MYFELLGKIENIEIIAIGGRIREIMRLHRQFGPARGENSRAKPRFAFRVAEFAAPRYTGTRRMVRAGRR